MSYTLANATDIVYGNTLQMAANCSGNAIFVVAATEPPYSVYGSPFGSNSSCGVVMSVDETGGLSEVIQNYTYSSASGVHGMAFAPSDSFLYSADDSANTLWTHSVNSTTGELTLVDSLAGPSTGADPRHVAVHPEGKYLYLILEGANELAQYSIDNTTGIPSWKNVTYPLIPSGMFPRLGFFPTFLTSPGYADSDYWSDEVALSFSNNYLWATSRARSTNNTGYVLSLDQRSRCFRELSEAK